jgi:hypothetical protein
MLEHAGAHRLGCGIHLRQRRPDEIDRPPGIARLGRRLGGLLDDRPAIDVGWQRPGCDLGPQLEGSLVEQLRLREGIDRCGGARGTQGSGQRPLEIVREQPVMRDLGGSRWRIGVRWRGVGVEGGRVGGMQVGALGGQQLPYTASCRSACRNA